MIVADVNVLLAAHLSRHPHHDVAHRFLTRALTEDAVVVPDLVWVGFVRLATNRRVFETPSTIADALACVRAVAGAARYRPVAGLVDGIDAFVRVAEEGEAAANLGPDAYIAALAIEHDCAVATFDRDFRRFDGLRVLTPE